MPMLTTAAEISVWLFLGISGAIVATGLLTGSISLAGLLRVKSGDSKGEFSPARVQALITTLAVAFEYVADVMTHPTVTSLPDPPTALLGALAASQGLYLLTKAAVVFGESWRKP